MGGSVFPPCCFTWGQSVVDVMKIMLISFKRSFRHTVPLTLQQATTNPHLCLRSWTLTGKSGSDLSGHKYCNFYKLKICGYIVSSKSIDAIFPTVFSHFFSLCHILAIPAILKIFIIIFVIMIMISDVWCYYTMYLGSLNPEIIKSNHNTQSIYFLSLMPVLTPLYK